MIAVLACWLALACLFLSGEEILGSWGRDASPGLYTIIALAAATALGVLIWNHHYLDRRAGKPGHP
jgi:hypothetical protein